MTIAYHTFSLSRKKEIEVFCNLNLFLLNYGLFLLPVVVDVLDVVIVLEHVDELLHVLDVGLIGQGDIVLGNHLHTGLQEGVALALQLAPVGAKGIGIDHMAAGIKIGLLNLNNHIRMAYIPPLRQRTGRKSLLLQERAHTAIQICNILLDKI